MSYEEIKKIKEDWSKEIFLNTAEQDLNGIGIGWDKDNNYVIKLCFITGIDMEKYPNKYKGATVVKEIIGEIIAY